MANGSGLCLMLIVGWRSVYGGPAPRPDGVADRSQTAMTGR